MIETWKVSKKEFVENWNILGNNFNEWATNPCKKERDIIKLKAEKEHVNTYIKDICKMQKN